MKNSKHKSLKALIDTIKEVQVLVICDFFVVAKNIFECNVNFYRITSLFINPNNWAL